MQASRRKRVQRKKSEGNCRRGGKSARREKKLGHKQLRCLTPDDWVKPTKSHDLGGPDLSEVVLLEVCGINTTARLEEEACSNGQHYQTMLNCITKAKTAARDLLSIRGSRANLGRGTKRLQWELICLVVGLDSSTRGNAFQ